MVGGWRSRVEAGRGARAWVASSGRVVSAITSGSKQNLATPNRACIRELSIGRSHSCFVSSPPGATTSRYPSSPFPALASSADPQSHRRALRRIRQADARFGTNLAGGPHVTARSRTQHVAHLLAPRDLEPR